MANELTAGNGGVDGRPADGADRHDPRTRGETPGERWKRNYAEILQEVRVAQTGSSLLLVFLLTLAFTNRFLDTTQFQRAVYVASILFGAAANCLLIAPAPFHRLVFRRRLEAQLVRVSNQFALWGVLMLMLAMNAALLLILDVVLGTRAAVWITAGSLLWFTTWWYVTPTWHRVAQSRRRQTATIAALAVASEKLRQTDDRPRVPRPPAPPELGPATSPRLSPDPIMAPARLPLIPSGPPALSSAHQLGYPRGSLPVPFDRSPDRTGVTLGFDVTAMRRPYGSASPQGTPVPYGPRPDLGARPEFGMGPDVGLPPNGVPRNAGAGPNGAPRPNGAPVAGGRPGANGGRGPNGGPGSNGGPGANGGGRGPDNGRGPGGGRGPDNGPGANNGLGPNGLGAGGRPGTAGTTSETDITFHGVAARGPAGLDHLNAATGAANTGDQNGQLGESSMIIGQAGGNGMAHGRLGDNGMAHGRLGDNGMAHGRMAGAGPGYGLATGAAVGFGPIANPGPPPRPANGADSQRGLGTDLVAAPGPANGASSKNDSGTSPAPASAADSQPGPATDAGGWPGSVTAMVAAPEEIVAAATAAVHGPPTPAGAPTPAHDSWAGHHKVVGRARVVPPHGTGPVGPDRPIAPRHGYPTEYPEEA